MRLTKILPILILLVFPFLLYSQVYSLKNYRQKDGLNLSSFLAVEESPDGYIWFGSDGAGLIRYDGNNFDYLSSIQGRSNRHVQQILFQGDKILFSTIYSGIYEYNYGVIRELGYINGLEKGKATFPFHKNAVVIFVNGIKLYQGDKIIDEKNFYTYEEDLKIYGNFKLNENQCIFTSKGNYFVTPEKIQNLNEWLLTDEGTTKDLILATKKGDSLIMFDKFLKQELTILIEENRPKFFINQKLEKSILEEGEYVVSWSKKGSEIYFVTNYGDILKWTSKTSEFQTIFVSKKNGINTPTDILVDKNGDIWVTSHTSGIYRVSIEPFSTIGRGAPFETKGISFVGRTNDGRYIVNTLDNEVYIGTDESDEYKLIKDVVISSMTYYKERALVSTNKGIYELKDDEFIPFAPLNEFHNRSINLVFYGYDNIWIGVSGKGLVRKNLETNDSRYFSTSSNYFYNALYNQDSSALFFGSNNGVFKYYKEGDILSKLVKKVDGIEMGYYVGNSTKDSYGNLWFSFDNGLMGILPSGKQIAITEEKFLPSLLIYTLNSDRFGNLYVGSNVGVTIIKIDKNGIPQSSITYDKSNGFYGYETNMRSSFDLPNGQILLGTVEGAFIVKPRQLIKIQTPNRPSIFSVTDKGVEKLKSSLHSVSLTTVNNNIHIQFKSINSKSSFVLYSHRLKGKYNEWTNWSKNKGVTFNNLEPGEYIFEVRASIDGEKISEISSVAIRIQVPFYKNKWFIIVFISLVVIIYLVIIDRNKKYDKKNIILSRDIGVARVMGIGMVLFGSIVNTFIHIIASRIDVEIENHDISAIILGAVVLVLCLIVIFFKGAYKDAKIYLGIGYVLLLVYNFLFVFLSNIHVFYVINTLIFISMASYAFKKIRSIIFLSLVIVAVSFLMIFFVSDTYYNQYLFLIGIVLSAVLMILIMYLRNSSLEQLIFTSGVINNGNALVVAFDVNGVITYASENIESLLGTKKDLKGTPISYLNKFYPTKDYDSDRFPNVNLSTSFNDGGIFVTPLLTKKDEIVYYQWSCKEFSEHVRVILGQDVTEKIKLENYYELIVRNAEDLIFQTDTEGNFTFLNERGTEILEKPITDLLGTPIFNLVEDSYKEKVINFFKDCQNLEMKNSYIEFLISPSKKKKKKWLGLKLTTMRKPGVENEITGFLGLARDVTEALNYKGIIEEQNKDITDSINYARRIQFNMLPRTSDFDKLFEEFFILYRPRDIVSGDFVWLRKIEGKTVLIVGDCTGHGVPGAFMTSLGINILNQIILEAGVLNPGDILNRLDRHLIDVLPRDGRNVIRDGMEVVVCVFDDKSDLLEYATAGGRFVIVNSETRQVNVIRGQAKHIGDEIENEDFQYTTKMISITEDHIIYLFSDGYIDQFGGDNNKKLTFKKFLGLLEAISPQYLKEQNSMMQEHLSEWIGSNQQTDDITVIGVKRKKKHIDLDM
ncbi:MAG: SpoIIE family protein phosphatase [Brumimicrobium sp.]|nr:SpoIIE family protein phosphatase [Brumimicrobium sp.]MCO5269868.1 SpoIIE family protein phosphatase [Brumimicrobium sp.]